MRIIIGCEESGVVRRAFAAIGHAAFSCDLVPARDGSLQHYEGDIVETLNSFPDGYWDLVILHPDCTKVATCGNKHWAGTIEREDHALWIVNLWKLAKRKGKSIALENPASVIWPKLRTYGGADIQFIQPWQHGHPEQKKTGLALHNLPRLRESNNVHEQMILLPIAKRHRVHHMVPGPDRKRDRSETYAGIAAAMAAQWGGALPMQLAAE